MPAVAAIPASTWLFAAGSAAATAAGQIYSAKKQGDASRRATAASVKGADDALAFQQRTYDQDRAERLEVEAYNRAQVEKQDRERKAQWEAEQARLAPQRELKDSLLRSYAQRYGLSYTPPPQPQMPTDWTPGGQAPATKPPANTKMPVPSGRVGMNTTMPPIVMPDGRVVQPQNFSGRSMASSLSPTGARQPMPRPGETTDPRVRPMSDLVRI